VLLIMQCSDNAHNRPYLRPKSNNIYVWLVPAHCDFLKTRGSHFCFDVEVRASLKYIKNSFKILSYHHHNGNVLNRTSMDIGPFITKLSDEI
jgi:hypothetical protein